MTDGVKKWPLSISGKETRSTVPEPARRIQRGGTAASGEKGRGGGDLEPETYIEKEEQDSGP